MGTRFSKKIQDEGQTISLNERRNQIIQDVNEMKQVLKTIRENVEKINKPNQQQIVPTNSYR